MSESELLERSDLVLTGILIGQSSLRVSGETLLLAVIKVDAVYKGPSGLSVVFLALPAADRPIASNDIHYRVGQSGLWFLRQRSVGEQGIFLADHPQRFIPSERASPQIEALLKARPK